MRHIIVLPDGTELCSGDPLTDAVRSVSLTESVSINVNGSADVEPGAAVAAELALEVMTASARLITAGMQLVVYREDAEGSRTLVGQYNAEKPTRASRNIYKVFAYDAVAQLDRNLSPWLYANQALFPMGLLALAQAVCTQCGVELANESIPNGEYQIQPFYAAGLTGRQLLQWVGQAAGRFLRARPDGKLEFAWYTDKQAVAGVRPYDGRDVSWLAATSDDELLLTTDQMYLLLADDFGVSYPYRMDGLTYEDYITAPLDKVQIRQSDTDVGVIYPADETGTNAYVVQGNLLLTADTAETLQPIAKYLYDLLQPVQYTPAKIQLPFVDAIAPGDIIQVEDANGREFATYIMTRTISASGVTLEGTGNASRDSVSAVNSATYRNLQGRMLEITADISGLNIKASELAGNYAELSLTVEGFNTRIQDVEGNYSSLSQTVNSLSLTVAGKIDNAQAQTLINQTLEHITLSASNGSTTSTLTLKSGSTTLTSAEIKLTGVVTFADLSTSGKTTINGDNITTGTIRCSLLQGTMDKTNCYWNTSTGEFRSGTSNGSRIDISPGTINQYYQNYLTGIIHSVYGKTYIGCNSDLLFLGWFSGGQPSVDAQNKGDGNFTGIWMQHVNGSAYGWIHCAADRFEIPGRIECGSLSVNGREI